MIEKLECTCLEAYKTRNMRDPNCCACSCDHNDLVEQLAKANERVKELEKRSSPLLETDDGLHSKESCDAAMIGELRNQLAKANERVAELEKERDHSQRMYNSLLGDLSAGYGESSISECEKHLKRFAMEKKVEALNALKLRAAENAHKNWIVNPMNGVGSPGVDKLLTQSVRLNTSMIDCEIEQLRKEQEK